MNRSRVVHGYIWGDGQQTERQRGVMHTGVFCCSEGSEAVTGLFPRLLLPFYSPLEDFFRWNDKNCIGYS